MYYNIQYIHPARKKHLDHRYFDADLNFIFMCLETPLSIFMCVGGRVWYTVFFLPPEEGKRKVLQLKLSEGVMVGGAEGSSLTIHFSSSLDIRQAARSIYGQTKNTVGHGSFSPSILVTMPIGINIYIYDSRCLHQNASVENVIDTIITLRRTWHPLKRSFDY